MIRIADNLREILNKNNWTQAELARRAEITPWQISTYIKGVRLPHLDTLCRLADAVGVSLDLLVRGEKQKSGNG